MCSNDHQFIISTYYPEWSIYKRKYFPWNIPSDKLTHLNYAFAKPQSNGELHFSVPFTSNIFKTSTGAEKVYGLCEKLNQLKKSNRKLKIILSIGGGSGSEIFAEIMADEIKRKVLVTSCVNAVKDYGFDGIDLDWEYPTTKEDGLHLACFMHELRAALNALSTQCECDEFVISIAINASMHRIEALNISNFHDVINFVNIMGYDYSGPWSKQCGHQSNIFSHNGRSKCTHNAINALKSLGVPTQKLILGVPFYGRAFCNTDGFGTPFNGVCQGTWEDNIFDYSKLPLSGFEEHYDEKLGSAYGYNKETRTYITYDNPSSIKQKLSYVIDNKLGGIMSWSINGDKPSGDERCLTDIMYSELENHLDTSENHIKYKLSPYSNIRE